MNDQEQEQEQNTARQMAAIWAALGNFPDLEGIQIVSLGDPEVLHKTIARAVGEEV